MLLSASCLATETGLSSDCVGHLWLERFYLNLPVLPLIDTGSVPSRASKSFSPSIIMYCIIHHYVHIHDHTEFYLNLTVLPLIDTGRVPSRASNSFSRPSLCTAGKINVIIYSYSSNSIKCSMGQVRTPKMKEIHVVLSNLSHSMINLLCQ